MHVTHAMHQPTVVRRRIAGPLACAVAVLVLACCASCTAGGGTADDKRAAAEAAATGRPVVSVRAARAVVAHYNEVNNRANAKQDAQLLATVEGGALYARSKADYAQFAVKSDEEQKKYVRPFTYRDLRFYRPSGTDWFAASARVEGEKQRRLLVFDKDAGREGSWKLTAAVVLAVPQPRVTAGDQGAAAAVPPGTRSGALAPKEVPDAVADLYATGGRKAGKVLERTKPVTDALRIHRERNDVLDELGVRKSFTPAGPRYPRTYALRTADGGVLAVVPLAHTVEHTATRDGVRVTPSSLQALYDPAPRRSVTDVQEGQAAVALPPEGGPRLLGTAYTLVDSH